MEQRNNLRLKRYQAIINKSGSPDCIYPTQYTKSSTQKLESFNDIISGGYSGQPFSSNEQDLLSGADGNGQQLILMASSIQNKTDYVPSNYKK